MIADVASGTPIHLKGSRDRSSGRGVFPAIPDGSPAAARYEPFQLSDEATLYSFTIIHPNPKSGLQPFVLAYADFPEQVRVFGRLRMPEGERPSIGMRLRVITTFSAVEPIGADSYFFIPAP